MNTYFYYMLMHARDNFGKGDCIFCIADEIAAFRVNFLTRPQAPDCAYCPLLALAKCKYGELPDCVDVGKAALDKYEDFFDDT